MHSDAQAHRNRAQRVRTAISFVHCTLHAAKLLIGISEIFERLPENCLFADWCERNRFINSHTQFLFLLLLVFIFHEQETHARTRPEMGRLWNRSCEHLSQLLKTSRISLSVCLYSVRFIHFRQSSDTMKSLKWFHLQPKCWLSLVFSCKLSKLNANDNFKPINRFICLFRLSTHVMSCREAIAIRAMCARHSAGTIYSENLPLRSSCDRQKCVAFLQQQDEKCDSNKLHKKKNSPPHIDQILTWELSQVAHRAARDYFYV